jgi:hypothetical protein
MNNFYLLPILGIFLFFACKNDPKTGPNTTNGSSINASNDVLTGNWVAADFISRAGTNGSLVKAKENNMNPYALAFNFSSKIKDSVTCYDSRKNWRLPVRINVDTVEIKGATSDGKSVYLIYHSSTDKSIDLINTTGTAPTIQRFTRTKAAEMDAFVAFNMALNVNFFNKKYKLTGKKNTEVTFSHDGEVQGLPSVNFYRLCTGGDCMVAGEFQDIIYMGDSKTRTGDYYGFRSSVQQDSLIIYKMKPENTTEKKNYKITGTAFSLLKIN